MTTTITTAFSGSLSELSEREKAVSEQEMLALLNLDTEGLAKARTDHRQIIREFAVLRGETINDDLLFSAYGA